MIKVGDTVKVISMTLFDGMMVELIRIGTICTVTEILYDSNDIPMYGIIPVVRNTCVEYYYSEDALEKGRLEWVNGNDNNIREVVTEL